MAAQLLILASSEMSTLHSFRSQYWNDLTFERVQILTKAAQVSKIPLLEATLRWMKHHSGLEAKDGIILGASRIEHLEQNLEELTKGPLPQVMVEAFEDAWEKVKPMSSTYFQTSDNRFPAKENA